MTDHGPCHLCKDPNTVGELWSVQYHRFVDLCAECYDTMWPTLYATFGARLKMWHFDD